MWCLWAPRIVDEHGRFSIPRGVGPQRGVSGLSGVASLDYGRYSATSVSSKVVPGCPGQASLIGSPLQSAVLALPIRTILS